MRSIRSYWPLVVICTAVPVYILAALQRLSPPVVALEVMNDLELNPDYMSLMFAMTMVSYALMQPLAGFWADRFGPKKCLLSAALVLGLGSLVFSQAQGLVLGLGSRTIIGLAAGVALLPCMKLAMQWFSPAKFGLISSCIIASASLSNFAVGRPLAACVDLFGWRGSFAGLGFIGLLLAVLVFLLIQDSPDSAKEKKQQPEELGQEKTSFLKNAAAILKLPRFWLIGFIYGITDMPYAAFTGLWVGPYLMEVHGQSEAVVGNMLSVSAIGFLIGPPLWMLLGTYWRSFSKVVILALVINVLLGIYLVFGPGGMNTPFLYFICIVGPAGGQIASMFFVLAKNLVPENLSASAMGFINIFPIFLGAVMQKAIGGLLTRASLMHPDIAARDNYGQAFQPFMILMIIGLALSIYLLILENRDKKSQSAS